MSAEGLVRLSELRMEGVGARSRDGWAVRDVSFSVRPGEFYTLLGPAGSGKTALLRMLAGFAAPDAGRIVVDDEPIDAVPARKRNLGMVFPRGALWPHMSVFDNVAFGLRARGESGAAAARKVEAALARVGLEGAGTRRPSELSPAQELRAALARTLVVEPRLLLLDAPLSGLEGGPRAEMRHELARLQRDLGTTTVSATRDPAEALALSTRIAVLSDGRLIQEGKPEELYWRPASRFVAEFVGAANLVPVRVVELRPLGVVVETEGGARLPAPGGGRDWSLGARGVLCLRPEALAIEEAARAIGGIAGTVSSETFEGSRQIYEVRIGGSALRVEMLTRAALGRSFKPGDDVKVQVSPETSILLPEEGAEPPR